MITGKNDHPIERIIDNAFIKMRSLIDADTIIGNPVRTEDGVSIIPISRVTIGFLTGGGEYGAGVGINNTEYPFAGGSGAGMSLSPIGFLVSDGKSVKLINIDGKTTLDKFLEIVPDIAAELMAQFGKKKK